MIIVYNIEEMAPIPIVYRYAPLAYLDDDGQDFRLNGPDTVGANRIRPPSCTERNTLIPQCPQKQKARCLLTAGSRIKLGTDLLSHLLRQYHRLGRA